MDDYMKKDIRYSNRGIVLFILIVALLFTSLGAVFAKLKVINIPTENLNNRLEDNIYRVIEDSMKGNYRSSFLNYSVRYVYISNYEETEKHYKDQRQNNDNNLRDLIEETPDYNGDGHIDEFEIEKYRNEFFGTGENTIEESVGEGIYKFEEPIHKIGYASNISGVGSNEDPQSIPIKDKAINVKGVYENGKITFNPSKPYTAEDSNYENLLKTSITQYFKWNLDPQITKVNFNYFIDKSDKGFVRLIEEEKINNNTIYNYLISLVVSWLIVVIFGISSNYKKQREVEFVKGIARIPIEVILVFFMMALFIVFMTGDIGYRIFRSEMSSFYVYIIMFIIASSLGLFSYYIIYAIKSFFNELLSSDIFVNSIIGRISRLLGKTINQWKAGINNMIGDLGKINATRLVGAFILLYLTSFVISAIFGINGFLILMFLIIFPLLFLLFKNVIKSFNKLNQESSEIAKGNYDYKVELEYPYFNTIADNFNTIGDNLNVAIESAVKSERLKSELITNVSHDLKTPLTSIINYSGLLKDENISDEEKIEYTKIINEKSLKLKRLIEDLFEVSKVTSNSIELNLESIDFKALLLQVIGEWEDKLDEKEIKVLTDIKEDNILINIDPNRFYRVLDNVFSNINKYAMDNSRVYLELKEVEDEVILNIKNISKYELNISPDELMERFTRGDRSRNTEGSGLGLSIASSLVEAHGGSFKISIDGDLFKTEIRLNK